MKISEFQIDLSRLVTAKLETQNHFPICGRNIGKCYQAALTKALYGVQLLL